MGGFPALPSPNNPYAAAAASGDGLASLINRKETRLQAAARQEAARQLKAKEDTAKAGQQEYANVVNAIGKGGLLANLAQLGDRGAANQADRSITLQRDESNPAVPENGKGATVPTPAGTKVYFPTDQEQGKSFVPTGGLGAALQSGGAWDGKTPMTPAGSHQLMQSLNEVAKQYADEAFSIDTSGKFRDGNGNPMAVAIGHKTKKVTPLNMGGDAQAPQQPQPAAPIQPGALNGALAGAAPSQPAQQADGPQGYPAPWPGWPNWPGTAPAQPTQPDAATPATKRGGVSFQLPDKAEKAPRRHYDATSYNTPGFVDEDTNEFTPVKTPAGVKPRGMTDAQKEADADRHSREAIAAGDRAENRNLRISAQLDAHNKELSTRKKQAQTAFKKATADAVTPEDKSQAARDYKQELQEAQTEYETNIGNTLGKKIDHNTWADNLPDGAAPKSKNDPAGVRAKPKADPLGIR